jgi:adenosine kinase
MNFEGRFGDHILPDKIHVLNVCFTVNGLTEKLGGTAGNIAYGLAQLGEHPILLGCLGRDSDRYLQWMRQHGVNCDHVDLIEKEFTAGAFITTDQSDNQITGFNPGAMNCSCSHDLKGVDPDDALLIISPGNPGDMTRYPAQARDLGLPFIFDPGQQLNVFKGPDLAKAMEGAMVLISNDYELEMIQRMTGLDLEGIQELVGAVITTLGDKGSLVRLDGQEVEIPAVSTQVKDPTGAGDAYRSGLLKGLSQGLGIMEAAVMGAVLASYAVACHGTQEYSIDLTDYQDRLQMARSWMGWR